MPFLLFALTAGVGIFLGETAVAVIHGEALSPLFAVVGVPAYALLGLFIGVAVLIAWRLLGKGPAAGDGQSRPPQVAEAAVLGVALLGQGAVVINDLVVSGSPLLSLLSLSGDLLWSGLMGGLFLVVFAAGRGLLPSVRTLGLLAAVTFGSYSVSSMYLISDRPISPDVRSVVSGVLSVFGLAVAGTLSPLLGIRLVKPLGLSQRVVGTVVVVGATAGLVVFLTVLLAGINSDSIVAQQPCGGSPNRLRPNVIVIVVDTLRADHLSGYGYHLATSPNIDEFGRNGVRFDTCLSPSNWTPAGHASIFTGRYPASHGSHKTIVGGTTDFPNCYPLPASELTLAEILAESGYCTGAVVSNFAFVSPSFGLDQGFDYWYDVPPRRFSPFLLSIALRAKMVNQEKFLPDSVPYRRAEEISDVALNWIDSTAGRPYFLFINMMDPHSPYSPPREWKNRFGDDKTEGYLPVDLHQNIRKQTYATMDTEFERVVARYDGEIGYVDSVLGGFFRGLRSRGEFAGSIIVLTSDHGEFLGEKGLLDHQIGLYQPVLSVPLIVKPVSECSPPALTKAMVQTVDIVPTVLKCVGVTVPEGVQGTSLFQPTSHPVVAQHFADLLVSSWYGGRFGVDQIALVRNRHKLIRSADGGIEMYDLENDPDEERDLSKVEVQTLQEMETLLLQWTTAIGGETRDGTSAAVLDDEARRRLEALGYVDE